MPTPTMPTPTMETNQDNFNTSRYLWEALRKIEAAKAASLRTSLFVRDGHVIFAEEVIGRFNDNAHAFIVLEEAGWVCIQPQSKEHHAEYVA